jgi:hypothetical protein
MYFIALYKIFSELSAVLFKWLDDSISLQPDSDILEDFVNPHATLATDIKNAQRVKI